MPPSSQKLENRAIENKMCLEAKECTVLFFSVEIKTTKMRDPPFALYLSNIQKGIAFNKLQIFFSSVQER